jgi:hypothetical protein
MVDFNQLNQTGLFAIVFNDKAAFTLIVNMFVVQVGKFDKGFIGFFKPVAHNAGVIIELVDKAEVFSLEWAEFDVRSVSHDTCE